MSSTRHGCSSINGKTRRRCCSPLIGRCNAAKSTWNQKAINISYFGNRHPSWMLQSCSEAIHRQSVPSCLLDGRRADHWCAVKTICNFQNSITDMSCIIFSKLWEELPGVLCSILTWNASDGKAGQEHKRTSLSLWLNFWELMRHRLRCGCLTWLWHKDRNEPKLP